MTKKKSAFLID